MPLTPEDVLNKTFGTTQFRRGYDEREVDDFLDEVVAAMRSLATDLENCRAGDGSATGAGVADDSELRTKLQREVALRKEAERALAHAQSERAPDGPQLTEAGDETGTAELRERLRVIDERVREAENAAQERIAAADARAQEAEAEAQRRVDEADAHRPEPHPDLTAPAAIEEPRPADEPAAAAGSTASADASGLIALAQRVHDEYVAQGEITRDQLVAEAQARHDELVNGAQNRHDALLSEASEQSDGMLRSAREEAAAIVEAATSERAQVLGDLERQRTGLEQTLEGLRGYEQDYRGRITDYFHDQLRQVDQLRWQPPSPLAAADPDEADPQPTPTDPGPAEAAETRAT